MIWLMLFAHAFNPLLLHIKPDRVREGEAGAHREAAAASAFGSVFASFILYLIWLGGHYLVLSFIGSGFRFGEFVGANKGVAYFLPFILGVLITVIKFGIRPRLRSEKGLALASGLHALMVVCGCYFMSVNYLAWLAE